MYSSYFAGLLCGPLYFLYFRLHFMLLVVLWPVNGQVHQSPKVRPVLGGMKSANNPVLLTRGLSL
jgi:hypothetical protein